MPFKRYNTLQILIQSVKEFCFWLAYFLLFKVVFVLWNFNLTSQIDAYTIWGIFRYGILMDLSAAGYLTTLAALLLCFFPWFPKTALKLTQIATTILLIPLTLLGFIDLGLYPDWGVRINTGIFPYMKDFKGVIQNLSWWQWIGAIALLAITVTVCSFAHNKMNKKVENNAQTIKQKINQTVLAIVLAAALILPIRGGLDTSPMSFANVYFSDNLYANHAAYNYFWSFMYTVVHDDSSTSPINYEISQRPTLSFTEESSHIKTNKPNIIVIFLESFAEYLDDANYTPNIHNLKQEGMVWDSCYATGNRSDKGMTGTFSGYPALIKYSSIVNYAEKTASLPSIMDRAAENDYDIAFIYSGDVNFYNTRIYMLQHKVSQIIERSDFPLHISTMQKWGAPDEYLYHKALDKALEMSQEVQPFMLITYNISSHPPFDIPKYYQRIKGTQTKDLFANSVMYADSCIGTFINELKENDLWDNTLLILTADHTAYLQDFGIDIDDAESYRIPMIWSGGAIKEPREFHQIISQTDLMATLSQQLGWEQDNTYLFSQSMFRQDGFATFYRNELWGYVSHDVKFTVNLESEKRTVSKAANDSLLKDAIEKAESYSMLIFDDFLNR